MNSLKRQYTGLKLTAGIFACEDQLLVGSKTAIKIDIDNVSVEDFKKDDDFVDPGQDFKSISFD